MRATRTFRSSLAATAVAAAMLLSACGGDSDEGDEAKDPSASSTESSQTESPSDSETGSTAPEATDASTEADSDDSDDAAPQGDKPALEIEDITATRDDVQGYCDSFAKVTKVMEQPGTGKAAKVEAVDEWVELIREEGVPKQMTDQERRGMSIMSSLLDLLDEDNIDQDGPPVDMTKLPKQDSDAVLAATQFNAKNCPQS